MVNNVANELGIELQDNDLLDSINFSQSVKELSQKNREANRRYSQMLIELDEIEDDSQAECLLRNYIAEENVAYYRSLAMKELDQLVD
ncbi:hypothetical protein [Iningainema tapete]|uniref:Uncharacterized protein n=1 Tax=Iningainema tapete BLCC-T55 TaxID=2748662 RepID=A0A8J6XJK5_9CYAN|nr:hypothetical protein [Iningainema tapete]MBD2775703.1 hypothetical protein [Iningainema tapete BLCC-T55]